MGVGFRLCVCLLFASAIISSARNTISIPGDEVLMLEMEGRSMEMRVEDYGEATANHGHDPRNRGGGSRRNRDIP